MGLEHEIFLNINLGILLMPVLDGNEPISAQKTFTLNDEIFSFFGFPLYCSCSPIITDFTTPPFSNRM